MRSICKSDYEKFKKQFDIKMSNEQFSLTIAFGALMIIFSFAFLTLASTERGYVINSRIIPFLLYLILIGFIAYEEKKHDLELFTELGYKRKRYFINEKIIGNILFLIITFLISIWLIIIRKDTSFRYLGFLLKNGFIGFLKSMIINYLLINLITISYVIINLIINLIINNIATILFKSKGKTMIRTFVLFILPLLIPSLDLSISNYNMRLLIYLSPIIILIEMYFEYKIIKNMDV